MRRLLFFVLGMLIFSAQLLAQNRTITGKVTDGNGNPIVGASVLLKGTSNGTITNETGGFSLTTAQTNPVLIISAVGYSPQEVKVGDGPVAATLQQQDQNLAEVVVVGYGTQKRSSTAGSISTVKGKSFDQVPGASFDNVLQ